ncbi:MAG: CotY/CotZ family spore coat protein [Bacilli bacterium]
MNNCNCNKNQEKCCDNCIAEILQVINVLQSNVCPDNSLNSCDRPALGGSGCSIVCNTRPIMLYTCGSNGVPWSMPTSKGVTECTDFTASTSTVFRVEKIKGCCATFRVLVPNESETCVYPYVATDSIFTMNINCLCSVRCLNDTYVECV